MEHVHIGLDHTVRSDVIARLQAILADEYVLFTLFFKFHWNVVGMEFGPLHKMFEENYEELFGVIDEVAERIRQLGGVAIGTLQEFQEYTRLKEHPGHNPSARAMVSELVARYEELIRALREDIAAIEAAGDAGTTDFLTSIMEKHEKKAWLLRAHIED